MTQLPDLMRRTPKAFYVLAFLFAAFSFGLTYWEVVVQDSAYAPEVTSLNRLAVVRGLYQALLEAAYLAGTGALIQIAIYIWDKMPDKSEASE